MTTNISLRRGCSLFDHQPASNTELQYIVGSYSNRLLVTSTYQRTALTQLALRKDPLAAVSDSVREHLQEFFAALENQGLINMRAQELRTPARNLDEISASDISINQLRARSAPELAQSEWIDGVGDGGVSTLVARATHLVELSGRSRVITLLHSILLASGVSQVRFADRHDNPRVSDLDIGFGAIAVSDLGSHYYETLQEKQRGLSLFPIDKSSLNSRGDRTPLIAIHSGECDPEKLMEWSQQGIAHLLIHPPVGDEIVIGPTVIPGVSPCNRCLSLYERDNFGFTPSARIPLTALDELPTATAHYVAAIVASQVLHFIDQASNSALLPKKQEVSRNTGIGEITFINFQMLTAPQVVAITRHPLCGCSS
jgi:hypothetical protein